MFKKSLSVLFAPAFFFLASSFASGGSIASLSITPSGNGVYTVQGIGLNSVGGINLTITYDNASLSSPTVSQGSLVSSAIMMPNTNNPGSIILAIINTNPISGSGPIAIISFANKGTGNVQVSSAHVIDVAGATVPSSIVSTSDQGQPPEPPVKTADQPVKSPTDTTQLNNPASPQTSMGTVTMPGDIQPKAEAKPAETAVTEPPQQTSPATESPAAAAEPPAMEKPVEPAANVEVKQTVYGSVLERFRTYQGEKTPATMMALFAKEVAPTIRQEPAIAISDGKTNVRITADLPAFAGSSPTFALSGARMVSLKKGDVSGKWILEALPHKNTMTASVTIMSGSSVIEYPLTTVSSVVKVSAEESYFSGFLKDGGTKSPKRDLNSDGRHDYLDDYIYTALFLIQKGSGKTPKK